MSFRGLLDGYFRTWRETESSTGNSLGVVERIWTANLSNVPGTCQARSEMVVDPGAGEMVGGLYMVYCESTRDVVEGDILKITIPANAFGLLMVDGAYAPRRHHLQLTCKQTQEVVST